MSGIWVRAYRVTIDGHLFADERTAGETQFEVTLGQHSCMAEVRAPMVLPPVGRLRLEAGYRGARCGLIFEGDIAAPVLIGSDASHLTARRSAPMPPPPNGPVMIDNQSGLIGYVETEEGNCQARTLLRPDLVPGSVVVFPGGLTFRLVDVSHLGTARGQVWYTDLFGYRVEGA